MNLPRDQSLRIHDCFSSLCLTQMYSGKLLPSQSLLLQSLVSQATDYGYCRVAQNGQDSMPSIPAQGIPKKELELSSTLQIFCINSCKEQLQGTIFALIQDFLSTTKCICTSGARTEQPKSQASAKCVYSCIIKFHQNTHFNTGACFGLGFLFFFFTQAIYSYILVRQNKPSLPKRKIFLLSPPVEKVKKYCC